ncbi:MAG: 3-deoxy-manno-octulosonate cytidylyltransferase [Gammaproteobacteria bacterium]|nr:3-deoxy-manno-octulosonate cytidylyltransferase [Gammaproteobacteria bacterium]
MNESFHVVIPARYASTRLPGKALLDIAGKPMVRHVWERACASRAQEVVVATDDARIAEAASSFGALVCITSAEHGSGTDRAAEVALRRGWAEDAVVVNVQGDEPLIPPANIDQVAGNLFRHEHMQMATLSEPLEAQALHDPNVVKVVTAADGRALYFSRATIPWHRDAFATARDLMPDTGLLQRHIGIYAYRAAFLARFVDFGPCVLETTEALEQLRALFHGFAVHVAPAREVPGPGIDTQADLEKVRALMSA